MAVTSSQRTTSENLLRLVDECDNFPYAPSPEYSSAVSEYWLFALLKSWTPECQELQTCGYIPAFVIEAMPWTKYFHIDQKARILSIPFSPEMNETQILAEQLSQAREQKSFKVLAGWRNELYPILTMKNRLIEMERSASPLFGIATRGVHCTAYTWSSTSSDSSSTTSEPAPTPNSNNTTSNNRQLKLIIPRRSTTKSTYPSMLDNTIAGGISSSEHPWLAHLREAGEEAGLAPSIAARAIPTGTISYMLIRDSRAGGEIGLLQPECQYCYDLELHEGIAAETPRVNDDEVAGFEIMTVEQAWKALMDDEFKPNCGLVLIDWFVRWGFVRAGRDGWVERGVEEDELPIQRQGWEIPAEDYAELVNRLHRKIVFEDVGARIKSS